MAQIIQSDAKMKKMYTDLIRFTPFRLCDFKEEATSYLETPKLIDIQGKTLNYTCAVADFNATLNRVTNETDRLCVEELPKSI